MAIFERPGESEHSRVQVHSEDGRSGLAQPWHSALGAG